MSKTPSTRMPFQTQLFVTDTAIVHMYTMKTIIENATFRKRSPEWTFFENDTVAYSCGRLKTELFDNDEKALAFPLAVLWFLLANFYVMKGLNL